MGRATPGYKRQHGLTQTQQNAIDLLIQGRTDQATADALGVNRVTVTKWRTYDATFQAALSRRRKELWAGTIDRLQALADQALAALARDLEQQQYPARTALQILRLTGLEHALRKVDLAPFQTAAEDPAEHPAEDLGGADTQHLPDGQLRSADSR